MEPELQKRVEWCKREEAAIRWLLAAGLNLQAGKEFHVRVERLLLAQQAVTRDLEVRLRFEEALWAAAEIRLQRVPIDGEDTIEQEDIDLALAMVRTIVEDA